MALIKCPECGKEVSDKAAVCIHCGYPLQEAAAAAPAAGQAAEAASAGQAAEAAAKPAPAGEERLRAQAAAAGFDLTGACPICGTARWAFSRGIIECPVCGHRPLEDEA